MADPQAPFRFENGPVIICRCRLVGPAEHMLPYPTTGPRVIMRWVDSRTLRGKCLDCDAAYEMVVSGDYEARWDAFRQAIAAVPELTPIE